MSRIHGKKGEVFWTRIEWRVNMRDWMETRVRRSSVDMKSDSEVPAFLVV
jgi:hypothetical protein